MNRHLVRDWMKLNPITITSQTTLYAAYKLMTEHRIRRLPVMQGEQLVGILTLGDIREFKPSEATVLSIFDTPNARMPRPTNTSKCDDGCPRHRPARRRAPASTHLRHRRV